ncbi:NUDIX hydrolase [Acerihabitans sp.]|uniref:NUDIX hydrolase n=1 Tax=Acerihabitans sp. TaxID=2811394 RepID=UPI002EDA2301
MFKPHVTVACVVQAENHFLIVEETIHGNPRWNQPAGHLEADETIIQAARRELYEEAGIHAQPQALLRIHQWIAPDKTPFLRFLFAIDLPERVTVIPRDDDIDRCLWLPAEEILASDQLRSPLVAQSILCYQANTRYPLEMLAAFQWPFAL